MRGALPHQSIGQGSATTWLGARRPGRRGSTHFSSAVYGVVVRLTPLFDAGMSGDGCSMRLPVTWRQSEAGYSERGRLARLGLGGGSSSVVTRTSALNHA